MWAWREVLGRQWVQVGPEVGQHRDLSQNLSLSHALVVTHGGAGHHHHYPAGTPLPPSPLLLYGCNTRWWVCRCDYVATILASLCVVDTGWVAVQDPLGRYCGQRVVCLPRAFTCIQARQYCHKGDWLSKILYRQFIFFIMVKLGYKFYVTAGPFWISVVLKFGRPPSSVSLLVITTPCLINSYYITSIW